MASAVGVCGISSRPDNPGLDRCFYENPVLARFVSEIRPGAGFSRILIVTKKFLEKTSYKRVNIKNNKD